MKTEPPRCFRRVVSTSLQVAVNALEVRYIGSCLSCNPLSRLKSPKGVMSGILYIWTVAERDPHTAYVAFTHSPMGWLAVGSML